MSAATDLLHQAWGQAKASPEYDKTVFNDLQAAIQDLEQDASRSHGEFKREELKARSWEDACRELTGDVRAIDARVKKLEGSKP